MFHGRWLFVFMTMLTCFGHDHTKISTNPIHLCYRYLDSSCKTLSTAPDNPAHPSFMIPFPLHTRRY